jgi:hypothetical protein
MNNQSAGQLPVAEIETLDVGAPAPYDYDDEGDDDADFDQDDELATVPHERWFSRPGFGSPQWWTRM